MPPKKEGYPEGHPKSKSDEKPKLAGEAAEILRKGQNRGKEEEAKK